MGRNNPLFWRYVLDSIGSYLHCGCLFCQLHSRSSRTSYCERFSCFDRIHSSLLKHRGNVWCVHSNSNSPCMTWNKKKERTTNDPRRIASDPDGAIVPLLLRGLQRSSINSFTQHESVCQQSVPCWHCSQPNRLTHKEFSYAVSHVQRLGWACSLG